MKTKIKKKKNICLKNSYNARYPVTGYAVYTAANPVQRYLWSNSWITSEGPTHLHQAIQ